jgi:uncharacterized protein YbjQ (UPF0145 family)
MDRMLDQTKLLAANAVVSIRFTTSVVRGGAAELLVSGTAIIIEEESLAIG